MNESHNKLTRRQLLIYAVQGIVLGVLASTAILLYTSEPQATLNHLREFKWSFGLLCFALIFTAWLCNGLRIYLLSRSLGYRLSYRQSLCVSLSTEFGVAATPAGMGGAVIRLSFLRLAGVPVAHGTSMLATDVAVDTIFFALLLPFALYALLENQYLLRLFNWKDPGEIYFYGGILLFLLLLVVSFVRLGVARRIWKHLSRRALMRRYRLPARMRLARRRIAHEYGKVMQGLSHIFKLRRKVLLLTFLVASVQWCCRYSVLSILLYAFGVPNNPLVVFFLQGILFTVSLLVVLPGGGGGVEVLTALVLKQMISSSLVGIVILLWRFFTYYLYLFGGGAMFLWAFSDLRAMFPRMTVNEEEIVDKDLEMLDSVPTAPEMVEQSYDRR